MSIGISILRTNQFYAYAVTPLDIIQQQEREQEIMAGSPNKQQNLDSTLDSGKLPTIPVESLSDHDILQTFIRRYVH